MMTPKKRAGKKLTAKGVTNATTSGGSKQKNTTLGKSTGHSGSAALAPEIVTAKSKSSPKEHIPVEAIRHKESRVNIPTHELRDFVIDDEAAPKSLRWPRDPSLDPQLVWKGKDEQDAADLEVPLLPIYIQEKIHPQALIENLRDTAKRGEPEPELSLFDDFNGIENFDAKVDFYHHEGHWTNRMILGDSLLVMASLAEKEGLKGKVQTIYFDPPYGIKFGSNWQVSTRKREVKDGRSTDATRQPEQVRAFRDTWTLGIHSYLPYLRDRLVVARELLSDSGSLFVQIGDENVHLARCLLDEVFGSENFCSQISISTTSGRGGSLLSASTNFVLWYAKELRSVKIRQLFRDKRTASSAAELFNRVLLHDGSVRKATEEEMENPTLLQGIGKLFRSADITSARAAGGSDVASFTYQGKVHTPGNRTFRTDLDGLTSLARAGRLWTTSQGSLRYVEALDDFDQIPLNNVWIDVGTGSFTDDKVYVVQTNSKVIERCLLMTSDPGDLVLDPTCGSGTTAFVAEHWGRRWITIDTSRVALALARTRLTAGRYPFYLLVDSAEGQKKEAELTGTIASNTTYGDIRRGFVYKRVPHVTLKSIANNPDIKAGMSREDIDAAIARHAESQDLFDKPYEDKQRVRVSGPFTVESLSPHRMLATDADDRPNSQRDASRDGAGGQFETMILDNLRKAGVQNMIKGERIKFDRLDPHAGTWIHAAGEYTDKEGKSRRIAISLGPEHGTVGPQQVKEAAKEAVQGLGFDVLVVCGFAFDPHVTEEAKRYGKLTVLPARMNADLAMGDELLKKTGAGNLFTVFGEPDIAPVDPKSGKLLAQEDGRFIVEIRGVDVYDPTTGEIRSHTTDDIACWFLDTDYNGESFFVRHAYFTGADEPYEKLQRALRAEIDAAAWQSLYSTVSRPFDKPSSGKVAAKVINHYGDEVLKVFAV